MKDSKRPGAILLVIDFLLLVLMAGAGFLYYLITQEEVYLSKEEYSRQVETIDRQRQELLERKNYLQTNRTALEKQAEAAVAAAGEQLASARETYDTSLQGQQNIQAELEKIETRIGENSRLTQKIAEVRTQYADTVRQLEDEILAGKSDYRICYLTFDDGPTYYTSEFLETLARYGAHATFFTIGNLDEQMRADLMRQEVLGGHNVQNHTYTHGFDTGLYDSVDSFMQEVLRQDEFVHQATGIHTDVVRFPAGSYYSSHREGCIAELEKQGYGWIDWCGNAFDTGGNLPSAQATANSVIWQALQERIYVVLMHDWNSNTLAALDTIIPTLQGENYVFLPLFRNSTTVGTAFPRWD